MEKNKKETRVSISLDEYNEIKNQLLEYQLLIEEYNELIFAYNSLVMQLSENNGYLM